eukprot:jgi/Tetstr1/446825/TSEL_034305.t1
MRLHHRWCLNLRLIFGRPILRMADAAAPTSTCPYKGRVVTAIRRLPEQRLTRHHPGGHSLGVWSHAMGSTQSSRRRQPEPAPWPPGGAGQQGGNVYSGHYPPPAVTQHHHYQSNYGQYRSGGAPPVQPPPNQNGPHYPQPNPPAGAQDGQLQQTSTIRNAVNLKKDSLKLVPRPGNPDILDVYFKFDSTALCSVTTFVMAAEDMSQGCKLTPSTQDPGPRVIYQKGLGLAFPQPDSIPDSNGTSHCVATSLYSKAQLSAPSEGERWPLVIRLETALEDKSEGKTLADLQEGSSQPLWIQSQTTFATLEQDPNGNWKAKVQKQKIWVAGVSYELQEIYGMETSVQGTANVTDMDQGSECVICMVNGRDTTVLPCRHMCMCSECANMLRHRTNRCPICRETVESLLHIKLQSKSAASSTPASEAVPAA